MLAVPAIAFGIVDRLLDEGAAEDALVAVVWSLKALVGVLPAKRSFIVVNEDLRVGASHLCPDKVSLTPSSRRAVKP